MGKKDEVKVDDIQPEAEKITFQEFCVHTSRESLWHGGLQMHAGTTPRTLAEWNKAFKEFKEKPVIK